MRGSPWRARRRPDRNRGSRSSSWGGYLHTEPRTRAAGPRRLLRIVRERRPAAVGCRTVALRRSCPPRRAAPGWLAPRRPSDPGDLVADARRAVADRARAAGGGLGARDRRDGARAAALGAGGVRRRRAARGLVDR